MVGLTNIALVPQNQCWHHKTNCITAQPINSFPAGNVYTTQLRRFAAAYIADPDGREGQYQQGKHLRSSQLAGVLSSGVRG